MSSVTKLMPKAAPARSCPMCSGRLVQNFVYEERPAGEHAFDAPPDWKYRREMERCENCSHFHELFDLDMSQLYDGDYVLKVWGGIDGVRRTFDRINSLPPEKSDNVGRVAYVNGFASKLTGRRLLDVGMGLGVFPYRMMQSGWECSALDLDEVLVAHAREIGADARVADVTTAQDLGTFDLITFNKVLEHISDPVGMLSSVRRLLNPGGLVYVELPDGEAAHSEGQDREEFLLGHIHVFSFASYALLTAKAGFQLVACERLREPSSKFTLRGFAKLSTAR